MYQYTLMHCTHSFTVPARVLYTLTHLLMSCTNVKHCTKVQCKHLCTVYTFLLHTQVLYKLLYCTIIFSYMCCSHSFTVKCTHYHSFTVQCTHCHSFIFKLFNCTRLLYKKHILFHLFD